MNSNETLKAELKKAVAECERLREENALLRRKIHGTPVPLPNKKAASASASVTVHSPPEAKVSLFKSVFRARDDVYAVRWERNGKSGYSQQAFANGIRQLHSIKVGRKLTTASCSH